MKRCTSCKIFLCFTYFYTNGKGLLKAKCTQCHKKAVSKDFKKHRKARRKKMKEYYIINKKHILDKVTKWRLANVEKVKTYAKKHRLTHPERHCARQGARRAARLQATPPWTTYQHKKQILEVYRRSKDLTKELGVLHHVDHIVPLKGKNACGLHVPWNLQILTATENLVKGNRV